MTDKMLHNTLGYNGLSWPVALPQGAFNVGLRKHTVVAIESEAATWKYTSFAIQAALFLMFCSSSFRLVRSLPSTSKLDLLTSLANRFACAIFHRRSLSKLAMS